MTTQTHPTRSGAVTEEAELSTAVADAGARAVVRFTSDLIAIDTTNTGGPGTMGERAAAEYIADRLIEAGGRPELFEAEPGRTNVILRFAGTEGAAAGPGIVVHGHLDVVPAESAEWSVDPFGGLVRDGFVWGRGAVDMKGTDAVMLSVAVNWLRTGARPRRDVVMVWVADEESGGARGAQWLCRQHADLFVGCGIALGEVGGFSVPIGRTSLYPIMTAERAHAHLTLTARGSSGHGSISSAANPIIALARALTAVADHTFAAIPSAAVTGFLAAVGGLWRTDLTGMPLDRAVASLGPLGQLVAPSLRHSAQPTTMSAGVSANVVPASASAVLDCRVVPGHLEAFGREMADLLGDEVEHHLTVLTRGMEVPFDAPVVAAITASLTRYDPTAVAVPYMVSASTDAAHFAEIGLATYGFSPLRLPPGFHFGALFHGRDERVPVAGLTFGVAVLDDLLTTA